MKKFLYFLIACSFFISIFGESVSAEKKTDVGKVTYQQNEITDIDELYSKAIEDSNKTATEELNISATLSKVEPVNKNLSLMNNSDENDTKKVDTISTTQLLKKVEYSNNKTEEFYATTVFTNNIDPVLGVTPSSTGGITPFASSEDVEYDDSYSVKAYSTYYYTKLTYGDYSYHDITSVKGGWTKLDSSVTLSRREVIYGATGPAYHDNRFITQRQISYPGSNTFSYTAPSSWIAVQPTHAVGVTTNIDINRRSSTWRLTLVNTN